MSEPAAQTSGTPGAPVVVEPSAAAARPQPAQPPPIAPLEERDELINHLGLPFFYRHTPSRQSCRAVFWAAAVVLLGVVVLNLANMPYDPSTTMFSIRKAVFGLGGGYRTMEEGFRYLFYQMFIFAIVVSTIIAPLLATFSLGNERVTGSLEFLRLSPMSSTSIVLGKMFAPAYVLHVISGAMLLLGLVFAAASDLALQQAFIALAVIVLSTMLLHAIGAYCACMTISFRGFGPVVGLLMAGCFVQLMPLGSWGSAGTSFLSYLSPWGAMDSLFWQEFARGSFYRRYGPPVFFGQQGLAWLYTVATQLFLVALLVWAAARKLSRPEGSSLPWPAWIGLLGLVLLTAEGTNCNMLLLQPGFANEMAFLIVFFAGLAVCLLCLVDHPHHRETVLAAECERVAENRPAVGDWRRMGHASFVALLTLITAAAGMYYAYHFGRISFPWLSALAICAAAVLLAWFLGLAFEAALLGLRSRAAGYIVALVAVMILAAAAMVPVIHCTVVYSYWNRALWNSFSYRPGPGNTKMVRTFQPRQNPRYAVYLDDISSTEDVEARLNELGDKPLSIFWRYHSQAMMSYAALWLVLPMLLLIWRRRAYARLRREALEAVVAEQNAAVPRPRAGIEAAIDRD